MSLLCLSHLNLRAPPWWWDVSGNGTLSSCHCLFVIRICQPCFVIQGISAASTGFCPYWVVLGGMSREEGKVKVKRSKKKVGSQVCGFAFLLVMVATNPQCSHHYATSAITKFSCNVSQLHRPEYCFFPSYPPSCYVRTTAKLLLCCCISWGHRGIVLCLRPLSLFFSLSCLLYDCFNMLTFRCLNIWLFCMCLCVEQGILC